MKDDGFINMIIMIIVIVFFFIVIGLLFCLERYQQLERREALLKWFKLMATEEDSVLPYEQ